MLHITVLLRFAAGFFLILITLFLGNRCVFAETNGYSRDSAVEYVESWVGTGYDVDGSGKFDCVDLAKKYFLDVGGMPITIVYGNAKGYANSENAIPSGWERKYLSAGYYPEPGDVAVWGTSYSPDGHVAIIVSVNSSTGTFICVEQSTSKNKPAFYSNAYSLSGPVCYIVPDFDTDPPLPYTPVDLGDDFYAYIRHQNKQVYLTEESNSIYGRSFRGTTDQIWRFYRQSNGAYAIVNAGNNGCIDVLASSTEGGATVYTYTGGYEGLPNQEFYIFYEYGAYYFSPVHSKGKNMLDMSETTFKLELWGQGTDWSPQEFDIYIIPTVNEQYPANVGSDFYAYIRHINKNVYLTNQLNNIAGEPFTGEPTQVWYFRRMANGTYVIENDYNGSCMDVLAASTTGGGNVYAYDGGYENLSNQRFYIYNMFGGYYFSPEHSKGNNMLDMSESTYNLEIWGVADTEWSPQEFMIEEVKYSVKYDSNGGTNAPSTQYKNHKKDLALNSKIPLREGYVFKGWATSFDAVEAVYQPGSIYC